MKADQEVYKWMELQNTNEKCIYNSKGKVLGSVWKEGHFWRAKIGTNFLGCYITEDFAKAAIIEELTY